MLMRMGRQGLGGQGLERQGLEGRQGEGEQGRQGERSRVTGLEEEGGEGLPHGKEALI